MSKCLPYLLAFTLAEIAPAFSQGSEAPFSITISVPQDAYKAGSDVVIRLVLKNTSREDIPYVRELGTGVEPHGEYFTDVEVRGAKGGLMQQTKYYRVIRGKYTGAEPGKSGADARSSGPPETIPRVWMSLTGGMLKTGESREEDIVVSKLYDLSQPGQYTITASRRLPEIATVPNSKMVVKSNTVAITITK